jgi:hypothetical protein
LRKILNGNKIRIWHFTTPLIKSKELLHHCNTDLKQNKKYHIQIRGHIFDIRNYDENAVFNVDSTLSENRAKTVYNYLVDNGIDCRPIVTGDFTQNEVMKYFDYEIHNELTNARYLHENGLFVGNQQVLIYEEIKYLKTIL